jgi:Na+-transporting methylmalonyl-CoA/oxaloacetate decarboxylase gamma subunit
MDRRLADRNLRAGLMAASIAVAVFGLSFVFAILYIS